MKFGVVQFPGSNCDDDAYHAISAVIQQPVELIWHQSHEVSGFDAIILPGGFSYGDYLRTGAIARFSPVMRAVDRFAKSGGLVIGICNGFQILLEAGLLPGAMTRNQRLRFLCRQVHIRVENVETPFTSAARRGQVLKIPIAHMEGNYFCDPETLSGLERDRQILFRYVDADGNAGEPGSEANPNGSLSSIAGICNREGNVAGLMPHPERAVEAGMGSTDGLFVLRSMVQSFSRRTAEHASA
jgi:phosphoribosylformylglycinamidine synthase I